MTEAPDVLTPTALIVRRSEPCPNVSGAKVQGQIHVSGGKLFVVSDNIGTWTCVGDQTA